MASSHPLNGRLLKHWSMQRLMGEVHITMDLLQLAGNEAL